MRTHTLLRKLLLIAPAIAITTCVIVALVNAGTTGIISGVVGDPAKGVRLSGVNIVVKGLKLTTVTDAKGYYVITNVPPGTYEVTADIVGYQSALKSDVQVMMDTTTTSDFDLTEAITEEQEAKVSIIKRLVNPDVAPTLYVVTGNQEELVRSNQPGSLFQVPALVLSEPGVVADTQGYPHIRGGRVAQIGYMLEGIPITEPVSNGFGTNLVTIGLSKMQVYNSGYRAEYGNAISGIFNEIKKTGREMGGGSIESMYGDQEYKGIRAEFGEVTGGGLDYYVGTYLWRTNYERQFPDEGNIADTVGKFVYPLGEKDKLTLLLNQGSGMFYTTATHTETWGGPVAEERDHGHQRYEIAGLTWSHNFSPSSFLTIRPYVYNATAIFDGLSNPWIGGNGFYSNLVADQRGLQVEYTNQVSDKRLIKTGTNLIASNNFYRNYVPALTLDMFDPTAPADPYLYTSKSDTVQFGAFVQDQIKLSDKWQMDLGLRFESMKYKKTTAADLTQSVVEPRIGFTFSPSPKTVWRLTYGKYAMFTPTYLMDREYNNPLWGDLYRAGDSRPDPEQATSIDLGWERQLSDTSVLRITPFYRQYKNLLQATDVLVGGLPTGATEYSSVGTGETTGCEFYLGKKMGKKWQGWLAYTLMRARANASSYTGVYDETVTTPVDWDQKHTLNATAAMQSGRCLHSLQLQYGSGLPWSDIAVYPLANTQRMGPNFVLNYGLTVKLPKGSALGSAVHLDIYNLFNSGTSTHKDFWGTPDSWIPPRFINLSLTKDL